MAIPKMSPQERRIAHGIGRRLAFSMTELDLTQSELALRVGCTQSTISDLLSPERARLPTTSILLKLVEELGVNADWLLFGRGSKHGDTAPQPSETLYLRGQLYAIGRVSAALDQLRDTVIEEGAAMIPSQVEKAMAHRDLMKQLPPAPTRRAAR